MKAQDLMTRYIKMCSIECTIRDTVQIMKDLNCGAVPIVNKNHEVQGIITDRDIAINTILNNKNPDQTKVSELMSKPVITVNVDDNLETVANKMKQNKIRRIPVVDNNNKLVGIISLGDLATNLEEEQEACDILEKVSTPTR
jgi:CBS domain-containing protein